MALNSKQLQAIELMVYENMNNLQICEAIKLNKDTLTKWNKKTEFQEALQSEIKAKFKRSAVKAQAKILELVLSDNQSVALKASQDVLSRAGFDAVQEVKSTNTVINVSIEDDW